MLLAKLDINFIFFVTVASYIDIVAAVYEFSSKYSTVAGVNVNGKESNYPSMGALLSPE